MRRFNGTYIDDDQSGARPTPRRFMNSRDNACAKNIVVAVVEA